MQLIMGRSGGRVFQAEGQQGQSSEAGACLVYMATVNGGSEGERVIEVRFQK